MSEENSFAVLLSRLQAGDPHAAAEICDRYTQRLVGLARVRLDQQVRREHDPEDVVQSVYRSFFQRFADGRFELDDWGGLWALLALITVRKCGHVSKHWRSLRRDGRRDCSPQDFDSQWQPLARDPTPSEATALVEIVEHLLRQLPEERQRRILELRLQGHTVAEISTAVELSERTVHRVLELIKAKLEAYLDAP